MARSELKYEIAEHIAVLSENNGINIECNLISFNGAPAKVDIRKWDRRDPDNPKMWKGISLTIDEAKKLIWHLPIWFSNQEMLG